MYTFLYSGGGGGGGKYKKFVGKGEEKKKYSGLFFVDYFVEEN